VLDQPDVNLLKFKTGTFTVMYPGNYGGRVTVDEEGIYTLNTRDDVQREDGHFGSWNSPDNFNRFVQVWVIPDTFKILGYESNRDGEWVEQNNTLTFYATDVNDLTFTVRYQLIDADGDGVADADDRCLNTASGVVVDEAGCEADTDHDGDGVANSQDECPRTPANTKVNVQGCEVDTDGVVDSGDLCPDTAAGVAVDATGCEREKPITLRGVNFHFNSDELTAESRVILDGVAATLLNHPDLKLEVAGHTDSEGVDEFNLDLSQRRSASVRAYLVSRGVNAENLTSQGYGEARPVGSNQDAAGRAANRRVELIRQN
jgi:outer membrane protein OmpA-like peptidoglycan-associated protein